MSDAGLKIQKGPARTLILYGLLIALFAGGCALYPPDRPIPVGVYNAKSGVGKIVAIPTTLYIHIRVSDRPDEQWIEEEYEYEVDSDNIIRLDMSANDPMGSFKLTWRQGDRIVMHDSASGKTDIFIFAE